ncbi:unnamed protein product [Ambrosiozyma monospora]|uniref:valine--tRNA ligase n=1 Tax=Ambrosiozyma monospora TaxID=43982 RepID=A0A9W6Z2C4_AMBMO|nr:unnamed protein product [Ambrosiozyma monospora]
MPYVTEEMWQRLPRRESEKHIKTIVKAPYPQYVKEYDNAEAAAAYELVLDITKSARSLLTQYGIAKNGTVFVESTNKEQFKIADSQKDSIASLIKAVEKVNVVDAKDIPSGCVLASANPETTVHVLVKGQVDLDKEIQKVAKKLSKVEGGLKNLEKTLNAPDYDKKASAEAKEKNQSSRIQSLADIETLKATIANLEKLKL